MSDDSRLDEVQKEIFVLLDLYSQLSPEIGRKRLAYDSLSALVTKLLAAKKRGCIFIMEGVRTHQSEILERIAQFTTTYGRLPCVIYDREEVFTLGHQVLKK